MNEEKTGRFSWSFTPSLRKLRPDDKFFEDGNVHISANVKQVPFDEVEELHSSQRHSEFECHVAGCQLPFSTLAEYEIHYNSIHRNVCSYCKRSLPSAFLLDLHILEWHDTMFELLAAKKPMYQCLVFSCGEKFSSKKERKDHLIQMHHYPSNFRFDRPVKSRSKVSSFRNEEAMELNQSESLGDAEKEIVHERHRNYRVPKQINFGRGGSRSFQRSHKSFFPPKHKRMLQPQPMPEQPVVTIQSGAKSQNAAMDET